MTKNSARLDRVYDKLARRFPRIGGFLHWVRRPSSRLVRIPLGILLILGGIFSILPVLGIWMLPLGLIVLSHDFPKIRRFRRRSQVNLTRRWLKFRGRSPEGVA